MTCAKTIMMIQTSLSLPTLGSLVAQSTIIRTQNESVEKWQCGYKTRYIFFGPKPHQMRRQLTHSNPVLVKRLARLAKLSSRRRLGQEQVLRAG
jgi:hypothetical protein